MEQRALRRWLLAGVVVCGAALAAVALRPRGSSGRGAASLTLRSSDAQAPADTRIRVEVRNASRTAGLAHDATLHLRERGFDVVEYGNVRSPRDLRDTTLVIDRSGHPDWARLVAAAMGGAPVVARRDSSRYLDVTVLVGGDWRAPADAFHP